MHTNFEKMEKRKYIYIYIYIFDLFQNQDYFELKLFNLYLLHIHTNFEKKGKRKYIYIFDSFQNQNYFEPKLFNLYLLHIHTNFENIYIYILIHFKIKIILNQNSLIYTCSIYIQILTKRKKGNIYIYI